MGNLAYKIWFRQGFKHLKCIRRHFYSFEKDKKNVQSLNGLLEFFTHYDQLALLLQLSRQFSHINQPIGFAETLLGLMAE